MKCIVFLAFCAVAVFGQDDDLGGAMGGGGFGGGGFGGRFGGQRPWHRTPDFVSSLSTTAQTEFNTIFSNFQLSEVEQKQRMMSWAQKYGVQQQMASYQSERAAKKMEIDRKVSALLYELPAKYQQLRAIMQNDRQPLSQRHAAIQAFHQANPEASRAIFMMIGQFAFPRPSGGFGGGFGGGRFRGLFQRFMNNRNQQSGTRRMF